MADMQASLEEYREAREALEAAVLPVATSVDGRRFTFQVSLHGLELEPGGYVAIEGDGRTRLGQLLSLELRHQDTAAPGVGQVRLRAGGGDGVVLHGEESPFHDAWVRRATPDEVGAWLDGRRVPSGAARRGGARARPRRAVPARCRRLRPPHFPVRPIGLGQDRFPRRAARGPADEDQPAGCGARSESDYVRLGEARVDDERYRDAAASVQVRSGYDGPTPSGSDSAT